MPSKVPTSFVPKQPVRTVRRPQSGGFNILGIGSLAILGIVIALAGAVFGYNLYLEQQKKVKAAEVESVRTAADNALIEELTRLSKRLVVGKEILSNHITPSSVFAFLERDTVAGVGFEEFSLDISPNGEGQLSIKGVAKDFNSLAFQSKVFSKNIFLRNQLFSDISVSEETGEVNFVFDALVSKEFLLASTPAPLPLAPATTQGIVDTASQNEVSTITEPAP